MQHNSIYKLTKEWLGDGLQKIKEGWLKKTKLNFSFIVECIYKQSSFVIPHCD